MRQSFILLFSIAALASCSSSKSVATSSKTSNKKTVRTSTVKSTGKTIESIVITALSYEGTPYKYAGISHSGMDCSGLMYTSFRKHNILLPRVSREQAKQGKKITLGTVQKGDLLFFKTNKNHKRINHVGLVVETRKGIKFIHSSSSRGVIVSSLEERYWKNAFAEARRVL
ncbi:C40 family peptidase [Sungkyunkwania multivorans]|uniref:C40 family peptidase n=1 Tax=Sungkyunkwania multivorans TaxID=1173618 RepID=A0ABW3D3L1_9FLAO